MGQFLRKRYNSLIDERSHNLNNQIRVHATDMNRCLASAAINLAGMFPPKDNQVWNENLLWQPIPIHTTPLHSDYLLKGEIACEKYVYLAEKNPPEYMEINKRLRPLYDYLEKHTGKPIHSYADAAWMEDNFLILEETNKT